MKLIGAREFNQDVSHAKRAANVEPVFITDRGRPAYVLMSIAAYSRLTGQTETIVDLLAMPNLSDADLGLERSGKAWERRVDLE